MEETKGSQIAVVSSDWSTHPHCPHGPTVIFQRLTKKGVKRQFYACSACRDRKDCSFFQWLDEKISEDRRKARQQINESCQPSTSQEEHHLRLHRYLQLDECQRKYCTSCSLLLLPEDIESHNNHSVRYLSDLDLTQPSNVIQAQNDDKMKAQYFFSQQTISFVLRSLQQLGVDSLLCIGTPRIHEACEKTGNFSSYLLDIDYRYEQFYTEAKFSQFNMFNRHFFRGTKSIEMVDQFLKNSENVAIVVDPPFGGLAELLGGTLEYFTERCRKLHGRKKCDVPVLWFFPYFLEGKVKESFPKATMLDFVVNYENHPSFMSKQYKKNRSPVRIFTNVAPQRIVLSQEDGYRYCDICNKWVSLENKHCSKCNICPSKDGKAWKHCDQCGKCTKASRIHCNVCQHCVLRDHSCGRKISPHSECHVCGDIDHKKRHCPKLQVLGKKNTRGAKRYNASLKEGLLHRKAKLPKTN